VKGGLAKTQSVLALSALFNMKENTNLRNLVEELSKQEAPIWKAMAKKLGKAVRRRQTVSIGHISKNVKKGEIALVPGKVLSDGELTQKITISALKFSDSAFEKVNKAGGKAISIAELVKQNPKGKGVRVIG